MADARAKAVVNALADLYSRPRYLVDMVTSLREPLARGDVVEVPSISSLTVTSDGHTGASPQSISTSILTLTANLHPAIFAALPSVDSFQLLDGAWAGQVALQAMMMLRADMDNAFARTYLARQICYDTSATYHDNLAGDAMVEDDILNAKAALLSNDGCMPENLMLVVSPHGEGSIMSISGFVPAFQAAEAGNLGIPRLGFVFGIPVYSSNSILRNLSVATTAVSVTSNVATATVAADHGFVPGQYITTSGLTTNATSAVAISSVTSTTIVYPLTAADGAMADGTGSIVDATSWNLMLDKSHCFVAQQKMPSVRIVPDYDSTDDALQVASIWGRVARAGRCRVIHSPGSTVS